MIDEKKGREREKEERVRDDVGEESKGETTVGPVLRNLALS